MIARRESQRTQLVVLFASQQRKRRISSHFHPHPALLLLQSPFCSLCLCSQKAEYATEAGMLFLSSHTPGPLCRKPLGELCDLADLQKVAVGIPEEAPDLATPVDRRRQEDRTTGLERLIRCPAVWHSQRQLMADGIRIGRRGKRDGRLVSGGPTASHQQQPAPLKREDAGGATIVTIDRGS